MPNVSAAIATEYMPRLIENFRTFYFFGVLIKSLIAKYMAKITDNVVRIIVNNDSLLNC